MAVEHDIATFTNGNRVIFLNGEKKIPAVVNRIVKTKGVIEIVTERGNIRRVTPGELQMRRGRPPGVKNRPKMVAAETAEKSGNKPLLPAKPGKVVKSKAETAAMPNNSVADALNALAEATALMGKAISILRRRVSN